jgi:hypothetical protein
MASKTKVDGNRVTIDDSVYTVTPAGSGQYAVNDEFGTRTGYFTVRGKVIAPEDYGVDGAHPIKTIGQLWAAANLWKSEEKRAELPPTKGVARVTTHDKPGDADLEKARKHRAWMKTLPGCKAVQFFYDPASGKAVTVSIWETLDQLNALKEASPPSGAAPLRSVSADVFPHFEDP